MGENGKPPVFSPFSCLRALKTCLYTDLHSFYQKCFYSCWVKPARSCRFPIPIPFWWGMGNKPGHAILYLMDFTPGDKYIPCSSPIKILLSCRHWASGKRKTPPNQPCLVTAVQGSKRNNYTNDWWIIECTEQAGTQPPPNPSAACRNTLAKDRRELHQAHESDTEPKHPPSRELQYPSALKRTPRPCTAPLLEVISPARNGFVHIFKHQFQLY